MPSQGPILGAQALAHVPGHDVVLGRCSSRLWRWNCSTGEPLGLPVNHDALHAGPRRPPLVTVSTLDGPVAVTGSVEGGLRRWNALSGEPAGEAAGMHAGTITALVVAALPADGAVIVSGGADGLIRFWDPLTWAEVAEPVTCGQRILMLSAVHLARARSVICALLADGSVQRLDIPTGLLFGPSVHTRWQPRWHDQPFPGSMTAISAGGQGILATCADFRSVRLWDVVTGEPTVEIKTGGARVRCLAAARLADGTPVIVTGDDDGYARRFDAFTGSLPGCTTCPADLAERRPRG